MLVVKVEVWPKGSAQESFEIARLGIANVSGCTPISDYELTALMTRDTVERVLKCEINKHERALGWAPLVRRAVTGLFIPDFTHAAPYDDPVAELLRKGAHV